MKLKLESLEVNSFTTKLSDDEQLQLNGGTTIACLGTPTAALCPPNTPILESRITINVSEMYTKIEWTPCIKKEVGPI